MRYCIAHNPLLLQPLGHWFTFIYRKCEHLAVGSSEQGLTRSRGHPHFVVASPSPVVLSLYHTLWHLSSTFLSKFIFFRETLDLNLVVFRGSFPSPLPLLYHTLRGLSRGFSNFFSERPLWDLNPSARDPAFNLVGTHLLTPLLYHNLGDLSRGFLHFCESPDFITTIALLVASRLLNLSP